MIALLVAEASSKRADRDRKRFRQAHRITEYTRHGRGTKGMIAIQQTERNGKVVAATLVDADDEIMLITDRGVLMRTRVAEIREMGRATQGVTLIAVDDGTKLSGLQRIVENDANGDRNLMPATLSNVSDGNPPLKKSSSCAIADGRTWPRHGWPRRTGQAAPIDIRRPQQPARIAGARPVEQGNAPISAGRLAVLQTQVPAPTSAKRQARRPMPI